MRPLVESRTDWSRPISDIRNLHLILSLRCNYRCEFCFQPNYHDDLPEVVWRERLAPVYPGLDELVLHGGEPTAFGQFVEFCELVSAVNPTVLFGLFTNGYRFAGYWADLMLSRGSFVNFSVNAATRPTYAQVNRRDHFDEVIEVIRDFGARRRAGGRTVSVDLSFVITPANVMELGDFLHLAAANNVDRVRFFFDLQMRPPDDDALRRQLDRAYRIRAELPQLTVWGLEVFEGRVFGWPVDDAHLESTGCTRTFDNLYVGVDGSAAFCNFLHPRPIGDLRTQDVAEVWNSPAALAQRQAQARQEWDYCVSAYCGPTERAAPRSRNTSTVVVPVQALRTRLDVTDGGGRTG